MIEFIKEFWEFLKVRKKYWLFPIIIVLALFGILIVLNSATLIVCLVALIIPSYIVTRISPSKSIKFN